MQTNRRGRQFLNPPESKGNKTLLKGGHGIAIRQHIVGFYEAWIQMTQLRLEFFEERGKEIERWREKGFVEIHDLVTGTEFTLKDLEDLNILQKKGTAAGLHLLDGHDPTPAWETRFREGRYMTLFLPEKLADQIMKSLNNNRNSENQAKNVRF